jgi:hypothetical protein
MVHRLVQQHARTSSGFNMVPRKRMRLMTVCMPTPARPLEHTSCRVFVWVATARPVLWAGALKFRNTVLCAVREWGMRNIWFCECIALSPIRSRFQHVIQLGFTMSSFMTQDEQRDAMYFVTDCLQFHSDNAPCV